MTNFVSIGKTIINVEHVLTLTKPDGNDHIWIEMDSGQSIEAEGKYLSRIIGMKTDGGRVEGGCDNGR